MFIGLGKNIKSLQQRNNFSYSKDYSKFLTTIKCTYNQMNRGTKP